MMSFLPNRCRLGGLEGDILVVQVGIQLENCVGSQYQIMSLELGSQSLELQFLLFHILQVRLVLSK